MEKRDLTTRFIDSLRVETWSTNCTEIKEKEMSLIKNIRKYLAASNYLASQTDAEHQAWSVNSGILMQ